MDIHDLINNSLRNDCFAIVIRHSVRDEIKDAKQSQHQLLTDEGRKLAVDFGSKLPTSKTIRLFHSKVERCQETALCIQQGFNGIVSEIASHNSLTGFFVLNPDQILGDVNKIGGYSFINRWFNGFYPENQLMNAISSRTRMIDFITHNFKEKYLDIYITHDWNVVLLTSLFYSVTDNKFPWPNYMSGVCFHYSNNECFIQCENDVLTKI